MARRSLYLALAAFVCILQSAASASTLVRNQYIVFSGRADLTSYLQASFPSYVQKLLPYSDPKYARTEAILRRVWAGYQKLSPASTDQLPTPELVILKGSRIDGFVTDDSSGRLPHAFFIFERVADLPEEQIAGLMAHELTHLLTPVFQYKYYQVSKGQEPLGFLQPNNSQVENIVNELQAITKIVGPFYIPELNGLPAPIVYDGLFFNVVISMAQKLGDSQKLACQMVQSSTPKWRLDLFLKYLSPIDQTVRMTASQKSEIDQETRAYISDLRQCFGVKQTKLTPMLQALLPQSAAELEAKYSELIQAFDQAANIVDGIFAVTALEYQKLNTFYSTHDVSSLRAYSHEEIADDNSVRIMRLIGYSPASIGEFFLSLMDDSQLGSRAQCESILAAGQVPPYGMITDPHHSMCFRVYHARQLAEWLKHN